MKRKLLEDKSPHFGVTSMVEDREKKRSLYAMPHGGRLLKDWSPAARAVLRRVDILRSGGSGAEAGQKP